jgi:hypothetical protein
VSRITISLNPPGLGVVGNVLLDVLRIQLSGVATPRASEGVN